MKKLLLMTKYTILIPVLGSLIASITAQIFGFVAIWRVVVELTHLTSLTEKTLKTVSVSLVGIIELFLLGTVLYVIANGLYILFIDDTLEVPEWLHVKSIDDLDAKLIGIVVILLSVTFLSAVVEMSGEASILTLGISTSLVIFALSALMYVNKGHITGE
jgi:uncharacterized membrane protein YqhA